MTIVILCFNILTILSSTFYQFIVQSSQIYVPTGSPNAETRIQHFMKATLSTPRFSEMLNQIFNTIFNVVLPIPLL